MADWWEDFGKQSDSEGPPFYGPSEYQGHTYMERCCACGGWGTDEHGLKCSRCDGWLYWSRPEPRRDACEHCHGERGGVPGNENVIGGEVLCDYCSADRNLLERSVHIEGGLACLLP